MASDTIPRQAETFDVDQTPPRPNPVADPLLWTLERLASLKLTVTLLAMAIFIVLVGTLAQDKMAMWDVVDEYFRSAWVLIKLDVLFPTSLFPDMPKVPGYFYFPGGWLIGAAMTINLLAAHGLRFKPQARGTRLWMGVGVIALGAIATWLVILGGTNPEGFQDEFWIEWSQLWIVFKLMLAGLWLGMLYMFLELIRRGRREPWLLAVCGGASLLVGGVLFYILLGGSAVQLADPSMRILWQLLQATFAAGVLLAGSIMVFRKRGGIVVIHGGIALMMLSEVLVGTTVEEGVMVVEEGRASNFAESSQKEELAIIDSSDPQEDRVVVVPEAKLVPGKRIADEQLPFDIEVLKHYRNSAVVAAEHTDDNPATHGRGTERVAVERPPVPGASKQERSDIAATYARLVAKDGSDLGTWLFRQYEDGQKIEVEGRTYDVALRSKRLYKPYWVFLENVERDNYLGSSTPRDYSSYVRLFDPERGQDRDNIRIWMNNPLRYAGETLYQVGHSEPPEVPVETTGLQIVSNSVWMIPYVGCMIVVVGLGAHFLLTLVRFLNRREAGGAIAVVEDPEAPRKARQHQPGHQPSDAARIAGIVVPCVVVLLAAGWVGSKLRMPKPATNAMNIHEFGKLPVHYDRVKPLDTLARNLLRQVSNKQTFLDADENKQPAIRWLLDVAAKPEVGRKHRFVRIDNREVLATLKIEPHPSHLYSIDEIDANKEEFDKQLGKVARKQEAASRGGEDPSLRLTAYERKLVDLRQRLNQFALAQLAFIQADSLAVPGMPTAEELEENPELRDRWRQIYLRVLAAQHADWSKRSLPLLVPVEDAGPDGEPWRSYPVVAIEQAMRELIPHVHPDVSVPEPDPYYRSLRKIIVAYADDDVSTFNKEVAAYRATLEAEPPAKMDPAVVRFETFFNHVEPFYHAAALYLFAFALAALGWLGFPKPLQRASFWLIAFTFLLHTLAIVGRIYISGRPPVTTLYTSALFIGWAAVLLGMILEGVFRVGIGNAVGAIAGFGTLVIAHQLTTAVSSFRGDTFTVLQAVLDTQFWLATHVVCITLGYATTYFAGLLGIVYVLGGVLTPALTPPLSKNISRMIYGTVCFSMLFSFFGTVLGGLWADDSWGRFWGWDPKENGALIIVLWNALILHARWGGMVKERGLAVLAVAGNIAVSWSWFGVNELGVGLHAYGFTEGALKALGLFAASQLAIIGIGLMPRNMWVSNVRHGPG